MLFGNSGDARLPLRREFIVPLIALWGWGRFAIDLITATAEKIFERPILVELSDTAAIP